MNISEFYKYSWFAELAYVEWENTNGTSQNAIDAASAYKRAPQALAEKIFMSGNENYSVLSYHANEDDDSGFNENKSVPFFPFFLTSLLEVSANKADHTLESAVTALGKLFVTGFTPNRWRSAA